MAYAIGTHGFADRCAPSYQLATGTDLELALIYQAVARGWAVVVTDYEGLGTPGDHTYFVQLSEGHAVLDSVRAAMNLLPANVSQDAPVGLWGYSQGGGAAGMAAELAGNYAPELRAVGVAEGGVIADVRAVLRRVARLPAMNGVLPGVVAAYARAYPGLHLDRFYTEAGRRGARRIGGQCVEALAVNAATPPGRAFTADPLEHRPLLQKLADNSLGQRLPDMPILIYQSVTDEGVPYEQAQRLFQRYCAMGATVQLHAVPGEHLETGTALAPVAVQWLADRFAGHAARAGCPVSTR